MRLAFLLLTVCGGVLGHAVDYSNLQLTKTIVLPGVEGRFDHFTIDVKGQRLFVAALGNNTLEVIDLAAGKCLRSVPGMSKPTGVLYLPEPNRVLVANGNDGTLKVLDGADFKLIRTIDALPDADNLRLDPKLPQPWLGYGAGALAKIDIGTGKRLENIALPAHPESFQLEAEGSRLFVNVPDAKQITVIDRDRKTIVSQWKLKRFLANFPMALDEPNHRLFVGCRQPARLLVLDTQDGNPVADLAIAGDIDDLFFNASRKQLYLSCGAGFIEVIDQRTASQYQLHQHIPTRAGARTAFFSKDLESYYLAVPKRGNQVAEIRVYKLTL